MFAGTKAALLEDELEDVPLDVGSSEDGDGEWEMEAVGNFRLDFVDG